MSRPRLVDLFCCAGGAAKGYHDAGFEVVGVDIEPQPDYPYEFHQADALTFPLDGFDAAHGSPPCQGYTPLNAYNHATYPDLVAATRAKFEASGLPYVIENVPQAPMPHADTLDGAHAVLLCGPMFGLKVYRERLFELGGGAYAAQPPHKDHIWLCARNGYLPTPEKPFMSIHGGKHSRAWQRAAAECLDVPWMIARPGMDALTASVREVCEAIPPAYTRYVGAALLGALEREAVA
jgi:DNA (cytosine-5)-methyltransferase 1